MFYVMYEHVFIYDSYVMFYLWHMCCDWLCSLCFMFLFPHSLILEVGGIGWMEVTMYAYTYKFCIFGMHGWLACVSFLYPICLDYAYVSLIMIIFYMHELRGSFT